MRTSASAPERLICRFFRGRKLPQNTFFNKHVYQMNVIPSLCELLNKDRRRALTEVADALPIG
jgi:hypothetical protein